MDTNNNSGTATLDRSTGYYVKKHNGKKVSLHRIIIGAKADEIVDHINGIKTDNRTENLRIVTKSQNNRNRRATGYTLKNGKYEVKTTYNNRTYYIGRYKTPELASVAYRAVTKFAFDITGIDVNTPKDTIEIEGKKYTVDEIKKALGKEG